MIRYRVARAVLWEGEHAVLRWNATGTEWRVPIEQAVVTVVLPEALDDAHVQYDAWTGRYGAKQKDFARKRVDPRTAGIHHRPARRRAKGSRSRSRCRPPRWRGPRSLRRLGWWLADNFVYGLIPLGLAAGFGVWYLRGRDVAGLGTVVVNYEPPEGLGPAEVGTLADEKVDLRDVSSVLIDLAVRGFTLDHGDSHGGHALGLLNRLPVPASGSPGQPQALREPDLRKVFDGRDQVKLSEPAEQVLRHGGERPSADLHEPGQNGYFDGNPEWSRLKYSGARPAGRGRRAVLAMGIQYALDRSGIPRARRGDGGRADRDRLS